MALRRWILRKFSRITSSGAFVPEIDGLRFVAISAVVCFHIYSFSVLNLPTAQSDTIRDGFVPWLLNLGGVGVPLFFAISGFILSVPFARHRLLAGPTVSLRKYFTRRLTRLEPPYIVHLFLLTGFTLLGLAIGAIQPAEDWGEPASSFMPKHLLTRLVYCHTLIFGSNNRLNGALWSLEVEVQFYLLVPLITRIYALRSTAGRRGLLLALIVGFSALAFFIRQGGFPRLEDSIFGQLQYFLVGFLLADVYLVDWNEDPKHGFAWDLLCLAGWCAIPMAAAWARIALPLIMFATYVGVFRSVLCNRLFCNPWLTTIGGMCYTIYMYHNLVIPAVGNHTARLAAGGPGMAALLVQLALISLIVLAVSAPLFVFIEKVFMRRDWHTRAWAAVRRRLQPVTPTPRTRRDPVE